MGKKDKNKKKGKGAEKTAAKTEKKLTQKRKKELAAIGEDDIEKIVAEIEKEEKKRLQVVEKVVEPPSRRVNFSLVPHPLKDELILFGGEFFNGQKTFLYNDLFLYKPSRNEWLILKAPAGPPPRCGHQMVALSANQGQLWLFGGEYASPSQEQFYHYRDLWLFHMADKKWEKINAPGGPSARSGHRMVCVKKQLIVFGGFHDVLRDYKYFNDLYAFNLENYTWVKLEPSGTPPSPRSGCVMAALPDGRVMIYGGYSKTRVKKDVDKGNVHTDMFILSPEIQISGKKDKDGKSHRRRRKEKDSQEDKEADEGSCSEEEEEDVEEALPAVIEDGVFTMTLGTASTSTVQETVVSESSNKTKYFVPSPRMNCGLAVKGGVLYLYGGMIEDGDRQYTYSDFYSLDLHKLDEWKTIIPNDLSTQEWFESDSSSDNESENEEDSESEEEAMEEDNNEEESDITMDELKRDKNC
ncbi:Kelch domain-containing protein 4-like Protein [Gryllus bimaculatus]|nr:Kelch domain-containing protein 4-like Protein [Gryllus bimaculatus]